jgi:preprotein translocase subunit SecE
MAKLLDHSFPDATVEYNTEAMQRFFRDIEIALTKIEFPTRVEGIDENQAITWFFG